MSTSLFKDSSCYSRIREEGCGYVYVATTPTYHENHTFKIGKTDSLDECIHQLNVGSIENFEFVYTFYTDKFTDIVKHIHHELSRRHICREFYKLDDLECIFVMCRNYGSV
jgi:hypothetical protein